MMPSKKAKTNKIQISQSKNQKKDVQKDKENENFEQNFKKLIPVEYEKTVYRDIDSKKLKYIGKININTFLSKKNWKSKKDSIENILNEKDCMSLMITEIKVKNKFDKKLYISGSKYFTSPQDSEKHGGIIFY